MVTTKENFLAQFDPFLVSAIVYFGGTSFDIRQRAASPTTFTAPTRQPTPTLTVTAIPTPSPTTTIIGCSTLYQPVCASRGNEFVTYPTACDATASGARVVYPGNCQQAGPGLTR